MPVRQGAVPDEIGDGDTGGPQLRGDARVEARLARAGTDFEHDRAAGATDAVDLEAAHAAQRLHGIWVADRAGEAARDLRRPHSEVAHPFQHTGHRPAAWRA